MSRRGGGQADRLFFSCSKLGSRMVRFKAANRGAPLASPGGVDELHFSQRVRPRVGASRGTELRSVRARQVLRRGAGSELRHGPPREPVRRHSSVRGPAADVAWLSRPRTRWGFDRTPAGGLSRDTSQRQALTTRSFSADRPDFAADGCGSPRLRRTYRVKEVSSMRP